MTKASIMTGATELRGATLSQSQVATLAELLLDELSITVTADPR